MNVDGEEGDLWVGDRGFEGRAHRLQATETRIGSDQLDDFDDFKLYWDHQVRRKDEQVISSRV